MQATAKQLAPATGRVEYLGANATVKILTRAEWNRCTYR